MAELSQENRWSWHRFWWGCVGGFGVEVLRFVKILGAPSPHFSGPTALYIIMPIIMVILGGLFASAWGEDQPVRCIYAGATFPFWLSGWTHGQ